MTESVTITPADVAARVRAEFESMNTRDADKIADLYSGGVGFGYRTRDARAGHPDKEAYRDVLKWWVDQFESYTATVDQIEAAVEGDVGLAWGFCTEELTMRGREPEKISIRFTQVIKREPSGWRTLLFQRDAQPFDSEGRYIPSAVHHG